MFNKILQFFLLTVIILYNSNSYCQWYFQNTNTFSNLNSVFFIDRLTGFACGAECVLKTTNGGNSWINSFLPGNLTSIHFTDFNNGYICGENGKIFKTTNSGKSWDNLPTGVTRTLQSIFFLNQNFGLAVGRQSTIIKTTNGGSNWQHIITGNDSIDFLSLKILSSNNFLISGTSSTIFKSTDAGINWEMFSSAFRILYRHLSL